MAETNFNSTVEALFKGMDGFLTTKTVVGEAVKFDDGTIILPLVDVSFGVGAGAWAKDTNKGTSGGGLGGKISPSSVVVLKDGHAKLVNVKNQDTVTKILDMIPDLVDKVTETIKDKKDLKNKIKTAVENTEASEEKTEDEDAGLASEDYVVD